jgi:leucyl aminopeptidase
MSLKITVSGASPLSLNVDALAIGVADGAKRKGLLKDLATALGSGVNKAIKRGEFSGKRGQLVEIGCAGGALKAGAVYLVGLGDPDTLSYADLRRLAAKAARRANASACPVLGFVAPEGVDGAERAIAEGAVLGGYRFEKYLSEDRQTKFPLAKVTILTTRKINADIRDEVSKAQAVAEAVCIARDLINLAPNDLYPESLAAYARNVAAERKDKGLTCSVLNHKQLVSKGMNLIDAVGRGSSRGPVLIHLKYRPKGGKNLPKLAFVGKGVTFDTGGICLKPAPGMDEMKGDMGGAANVVAFMAAVAEIGPQAEIHGIIGAAENMPDGDAYRPGDVFTSYKGTSVEIINTDAEGRLVLADALHYACEQEPEMVLCNATLTGACVVALGPTVSGFYSTDGGLADRLRAAAERAGEHTWEMPFVEALKDKLKSSWADIKHVGDRWGGSITAALFLREFVTERPFLHVDIAGPSMADKGYDIYTKGGTGHLVLSYLELVDDLAKNGVQPADAAAEDAPAADAG